MYLIAELCNMISMQKIWNLSWIPFAVCIKMQENDELNQGFLTSPLLTFGMIISLCCGEYLVHVYQDTWSQPILWDGAILVHLYFVCFCCSVMSNSWWPHGLQHTRLPFPSPNARACLNSCPSSWWCHPTILSVISSPCLQSSPASGSFPVNQLFASSG